MTPIDLKGVISGRLHRSIQDIMSMFPIVKHLNPRASDGTALYSKGQQLVSQGYLKDGYNMINEGLQLFTSVYGNIHVDVINSYRDLILIISIGGSRLGKT